MAACDPGSFGWFGRITSVDERQVCIEAHDPDRHSDQPSVVGRSALCGEAPENVQLSGMQESECVDARYSAFPEESTKKGDVEWTELEMVPCPA